MSERKYGFKRKEDYSEKTLKRVKKIRSDLRNNILFIPNKDCIKGYYKGLVLFEKITDRTEKLVERCRKENLEWDKNKDEIIAKFKDAMPQDRERKSQQIIALNNMSFDPNRFSVCGFETVVSLKNNHIVIDGKSGNPEIDLVAINPSEQTILLIEYKCKGDTMLKGPQNAMRHYEDYKCILNSEAINTISEEMIKAYKLLCRMNGKSVNEDLFTKKFDVKIAFLFVDEVKNKNIIESQITDDEYENARKDFFGKMDEDVLYIRSKNPKSVVLENWRSIRKFEI